MGEVNVGAEVFAVGFFAAGGAALGIAALSHWFRWALGLAATFIAAAAATAAARQPAGYWLPPLMLGGGYLMLAAARHYRSAIAAVLGARRVHAGLILALSPMLAAGWVYRIEHLDDATTQDFTDVIETKRPADPTPVEYVAVTDRGTALRLYHHAPDPADMEMGQKYEANLRAGMPLKLIQTAAADPACNCHGWVFAAARFHLRGQDVDTVLADNGYAEVAAPRPGDVIVYRSSNGAIQHSGVVRFADGDQILVESKWGAFGRYIHAPADQPYSDRWAYYHGPRDEKTLRIEGDAVAGSAGR